MTLVFRQIEPSGVFPNWLRVSALSVLTLEAALFVRNAVMGQSVVFPMVAIVLTAVLAVITFAAGADATKSRVLLRRMAVPAGVMALGYGIWFIAALRYASPGQDVPHWVSAGLASVPTFLICAGFASVAYLLSLVISHHQSVR